MARRTTLDRGTPRADDDALSVDPPSAPAPAGGKRQARGPWRGAGGRWVVWMLRGVAWLVLLLIGYRGVAAIISGPPAAAPAGPPAATATSTFPATLAEAYALQFGNVYLNFSPATASRRSALLAPFLPSGSDSQLGWNGAGTERLQSEQVATVKVSNANSAVVTLLALVNDRMIELGVPIYSAGGSLVVSGEPALLPAPARAVLPQIATPNSDQVAVGALQNQLPAFFQAYAAGDPVTLGRFLAPGAQVTGLGGSVTFAAIQSVTAPIGGATRAITVVVMWHVNSSPGTVKSHGVSDAPANLEMTYRMTVVRQGTSWYVESIGASPQSSGPP
jgi:hypothetical protein